MDEDQRTAFDLSVSGHNLVITGQAGTGKTFLIKEIVKNLRESQGKKVSIVCSTGIAATHYGHLSAQTLHRWAGIEDGKYLNEEILHLLNTDERFLSAKSNIQQVETLIIDEISMISSKILSRVEFICRNIRNDNFTFGKIQVILVGDFFQLPPVSSELHGDPGNHCFKASWFSDFFTHKINLNVVHRQDNPELITCINELERGELSDHSAAILNSLNRPIENEEQCIQLFARNLDTDMFNYNKLLTVPGDLKVYTSIDEGSQHYLNKFLAPKNLGLKIGCPIMLLKNISSTLVNGLRGHVLHLHEKSVEVLFEINNKSVCVNITPHFFTTFDPVDKRVLAKRVQLPLKLAYAITIHKSQGMTLENVIVNCQYCIQPGQLGVAIGRAVSVSGLKVLNFKKHLCKKHPNHVYRFYESLSIGDVKNDLSCCINSKQENEEDSEDSDGNENPPTLCNLKNFEFDSDFSESEIENLEILNLLDPDDDERPAMPHSSFHEQSNTASRIALESVLQQFKDTPVENDMMNFKDAIYKNFYKFDQWFENQWSEIENIGLHSFPEGKTKFTQANRNTFFTTFNKYLNSDEFEQSVMNLLQFYHQDLNGPYCRLLTSVLFHLEENFFLSLTPHLQLSDPIPLKKPAAECELDTSGRGKLRYVSGYVLAKLKHNTSKKIQNSIFAKGKEMNLKMYQNEMTIYNSLCCSYEELQVSSCDSGSLDETKRKQNARGSLINISDSTFKFFQKLEILCRQMLTHEKLVHDGKFLFDKAKTELLNNLDLFQMWVQCVIDSRQHSTEEEMDSDISKLLCEMVSLCELSLQSFQSVITLFLKVNLSQFRKDYLAHLKKEKGEALRKKVIKRTNKTPKTFNMKFYIEDQSENKQASFLRLKSELIQNDKFLEENQFTKQILIQICKNLKVTVSERKKKIDIIAVIKENIKKLEHSEILTTPVEPDIPGPSGVNQSPITDEPPDSAPVLSEPETSQAKVSRTSRRRGKGKGRGKQRVDESVAK